jgi:hypothetical protein
VGADKRSVNGLDRSGNTTAVGMSLDLAGLVEHISANNIMARGKKLYDQGKYRYAVEILNKRVFAEPHNQAAKDLLADVYEQIGYQQESPSVRNSFLAGAYEPCDGIPKGASPKSTGPDMNPRKKHCCRASPQSATSGTVPFL